MNPKIKIIAYALLAVCTLWFGYSFFSSLSRASAPRPERVQPDDEAASTNSVTAAVTNATSATSTNAAEDTNAIAAATNAVPAQTNKIVKAQAPPPSNKVNWGSFGMMLVGVLGLAILGAYDISRFFATRVDELVFNDNLEGVKDPEYEEAEQVWASGKHLEAVQLMRDYLKNNPREQHVALRIAEIYEKDLGNYLAAALEYEEILKKKLAPDRWGWAAIHLSNLYSGKLNKPNESIALLNRIVVEYGKTPAAKKARERLGIPEPVEEKAPEPTPEPPPPEPPKSNLPPGFRPK
jgi:hypothetical protein